MTVCRVLFVGQTVPGSRTLQRIQAMERLGHSVEVISTNRPGATYEDRPGIGRRIRHRLRMPEDQTRANAALVEALGKESFEIVWLERTVEIRGSTLAAGKKLRPEAKFIWYAEDDMMNPNQRSRYVEQAIPLFDLWVTTKSFNARPEEMPALGANKVMFVDNAFDPEIHRPWKVDDEMRANLGGDIGFVGTFETTRAGSLRRLAEHGFDIRVWGNGWEKLTNPPPSLKLERRPVYDDDYAKAVSASKINLCFLRQENRDLQTCRSVEIPAIGGFMLHERNDEITGLLSENQAAAYFGNDEELCESCARWLKDDDERQKVRMNGHKYILNHGFRHDDRIAHIFEAALSLSKTGQATT